MIKIGKRNISEVLKQIFSLNFINIIKRFFSVHENPIYAMINEFFSLGKYPKTINVMKKYKIKLYSLHDFSTFNLIFCREDYFKPKNIKTVVDIGSNIGISALYWYIDNPNCKIYSFEPSSKNFIRQKSNTKNFKKNIIIKKVGISNKNEIIKLYLSKCGVNNSKIRIINAKNERVKLVNINDILEKIIVKSNTIDVLKIDVEGLEENILRVIKKKYFNKIKVINIEGKNYNNLIPKYFTFSFKGSASRFINDKY